MSNIEDIENVRSFLFKLKDGTELKLVEKENYDKLVERIKELEEILLKVKDKNITLFITCRNSIPKQKVKDLKESIMLEPTIVGGRRNAKTLEYGIKLGKIKACEELLEDK